MISPVKTIIANMSDRPCRLYLKGRSLYIISSKGNPGSVVEIEGDVFSRMDSNTESEFFLEQILRGYICISYSVDERFICTSCPDNTNMDLPSKFAKEYRKGSSNNTSSATDEKNIVAKEESKETPKEESKETPKEESKEEPKELTKEESKETPKEESKDKTQETQDINNARNGCDSEKETEEKPKKSRKIKVQ